MGLRVDRRGDDGLPEGLATASRAVMAEHGLDSGDHASVHGADGEVGMAQVLPDADAGDAFCADARLRRLLGVEPGDEVRLSPADVVSADRVRIEIEGRLDTVDSLPLYVRDRLIGQALVEGQRLRIERDSDATGAGAPTVVAEVRETEPRPRVVVRDWTSVRVSTALGERAAGDGRAGAVSSRPTAADVGGLDDAVDELRELVGVVLHRPDLFARFGVDPPTGVLLSGPAGTGKTLLARAVATHAGADVERVSGPALVSAPDDSSASRFRELSAAAAAADPTVVVLDDVDALSASDAHGGQSRAVSRLLAVMDDLDRRSRTVVIGTTTRPEEIDAGLRRPGRFDREVEIGVPDRDGREEILRIHTRPIPLADDVDLSAYAARTHGFVGSDLVQLVRESVVTALRRHGEGDASDALDTLDASHALDDLAVDVTTADVEQAFRATEPSALRELLTEVPAVSWADVGGLDGVKERLRESVQWPLLYAEAFERVSLRPPTGILLYGPPGTGKTLLAKAVANEADSNFVSIKGPELLDKYVGESEKGVREVFAKARENAPTVVFFDEIDAIATERGDGAGDSGVTERVVSQLLTELDGLEALTDVVVIAATNRPGTIDDALLRPGRFDRHVHVGVPDEAGRREIFTVHTEGRPLADDVDLDHLARETEGYVGADIEAVCREAATAAVRRYVHGEDGGLDRMALTHEDFERALAEVTPRTTGTARFTRFRERADET
ncbi:AAA family ATPase [Salinigranum marinum]|uniref:AAA family ATPase n=1 Tax=Salinigranum marinum TaxID=1515595 RepID=UPI002989A438|nr:AAA family ATPase [Salinigranum marinum]